MKVPLERGIGSGYVKLIWSQEIDSTLNENLIVKVYDKFSPKSEAYIFDNNEFETDNLLIYPLLLNSYPPLRGPDKWEFLGWAELTEEDYIVPDFISIGQFGEINPINLMNECGNTKRGCSVRRNFRNDVLFTKDFESIKHMSRWLHFAPRSVTEIITMNLIKLKWDEIEPHLNSMDAELTFWLNIMKNKASKRNLDIRGLQKVKRMQAITTID
ncbi:MAG: hypothetical protein R2824_03730 [Saprospiraceae bacterium]